MASIELFPPQIPSQKDAFVVVKEENHKIIVDGQEVTTPFTYFSGDISIDAVPSAYSTLDTKQIKGVHISIYSQRTGQRLYTPGLNKALSGSLSGTWINTESGIILLERENAGSEWDLVRTIKILSDWVSEYGWNDPAQQDNIYKIQVRYAKSTYKYDNTGNLKIAKWLNDKAQDFSEWSTYCFVKGTYEPVYTSLIPEEGKELKNNFLTMRGSFKYNDVKEPVYSYKLSLSRYSTVTSKYELIEESDEFILGGNGIEYTFKSLLVNEASYSASISYTTINGYKGKTSITFNVKYEKDNSYKIITKESLPKEAKGIISFSLNKEEDANRIALKVFSSNVEDFSTDTLSNGFYMIKRSDNRTNFSEWDTITEFQITNNNLSKNVTLYDDTIESEIWYKYGVSFKANKTDDYKLFNISEDDSSLVIREFEFASLVQGGKNLRLKYDNNMTSYAYTNFDTKLDTIGSKYPYIMRAGNGDYRTFPVTGLVSFNMDDDYYIGADFEYKNLFLDSSKIYGDAAANIVTKYKERSKGLYDKKREYYFREEVMKFLRDGKPKLFKSPTEGNIIVRLTDISFQPNDSLNRLVYSFSATANEVAEDTIENYKKYDIIQTDIKKI